MDADVAYCWSRPAESPQPTWWRAALSATAGLLLVLAACATPVQVEQIDPRVVQHELTSNVISTGELSEPIQIVLHRQDLTERFASDPEGAIASLHRSVTTGEPDPGALFALAEMSFRHAEDTSKQAYYLAAAVYAFASLFPDDPAQRPDGFDPRLRTACDLYNRGLTSSFASADRSRVLLRSGRFALPFGSIDVTYDVARPTMWRAPTGATSPWWSSRRPTSCTSKGCRTDIARGESGPRSRRMPRSLSRSQGLRSRQR